MKDGMRILLSGAALLALIGSADAADMATKMPVKAPPVPMSAYDWSGFYLGGYVGSSWSQSQASTPPPFASGGGGRPGGQPGSVDLNTTGWTGGITAGYNLQLSPLWLVGVEGDFGYLGGGQLFSDFDFDPDVGEKNRWYATLRGRVGYVTGPSLIYLTGGIGFVHVNDTFGGTFNPPAPTGAISSSTTTTGGVFGAGIETKLSRNWSAKTEYLFIDGRSDHHFVSNPFGPPVTSTNFSHSFQVIKTGLNYRFDGNADGLPFFNGQILASNHNWSFYVGGNAGIGSSLTHVHGFPDVTNAGDNNVNGTGFAGGGQAGYNYLIWQKYLVGVEGDFGALTIKHAVTDWDDAFLPNDLITFSLKTNWYGTLRGRIGTTTGPALLYLTGGAAWVRLQDGVVPTSAAFVPGSLTSKTGTGWTWGGGTEVALDAHWSAKLESLYVNSGATSHLVFTASNGFPAGLVEFKERFVIVRFGLNYAFN